MATVAAADAPALVRGLQERTARAFPAVVLDRVDGWWLRYADGGAWWASSVLPHQDAGPADLPGRIRSAEEFYAGHGTGARFQISPGAGPPGLDDALAGRGYRVESPMSLQVAATAHLVDRLPADGSRVRIDDRPTDGWFAAWLAVHGTGGDPGPDRDMLHRVRPPSGYASVRSAAGVVAVGRAVAEAGWAGVFGMATRPEARGRGAAREVLSALARWAADHGAGHLYLQVEPDNTAAWRLYERAGFTELCRYHYRTEADRGR